MHSSITRPLIESSVTSRQKEFNDSVTLIDSRQVCTFGKSMIRNEAAWGTQVVDVLAYVNSVARESPSENGDEQQDSGKYDAQFN